MNLDEANRKKVADWIAQGLKLSEIQNRIGSELGITMTYMDVRLLVDDLKLTPKDPEPQKAVNAAQAALASPQSQPTPAASKSAPIAAASENQPDAAPGGGVSVVVDQLARPGAIVSGKVTFSDGNRAEWYLDQSGRLGLVAQQQGYRPPQSDLAQFQAALDRELSKLGF
jgi:hypothetical protein